ncbi:putative RNA recognition motif domain, nucleotide-binding alpha-beta plait domain superfamily [Helianthus debilis subsp. tardiflorus]
MESGGGLNLTKFFVSNLPEGCTPWELRRCLEGFGDLSGTYVAKKRDKTGSRFGFACFKNVKDKSELEKVLRGVRMGDFKLKVNIGKFAVENSGQSNVHGGEQQVRKPVQEGGGYREFKSRDSRSYMEALGKSKVCGDPSVDHGSTSWVKEKVLVVPDRTVAFKDLFGLGLVGRMANLETLVDFDRLMKIASMEYSRIQYLGGLSILISFKEVAAAKKFLDNKVVWGPWFSKLESWCGQSLSLERVAWLKILGVPLHILEPDILARIGEMFGKVLHVPRLMDFDQDLSACRVGILVGENSRIREVVALKWKDRCYRVWVEEETEEFIPDCLQRSIEDPMVEESPLKSSPIAQVPVNRSFRSEGSRQVDGQDGGDESSESGFSADFGSGNNNNKDAADNGFFVSEVESIPKEGGVGSNKIFFFKSRKRPRRFRRKVSRA